MNLKKLILLLLTVTKYFVNFNIEDKLLNNMFLL